MYSTTAFLRKWQQHHKKYLYFTLIELLVVVAIIAVLAALLVPKLFYAKCRGLLSDLLALLTGIKADITTATTPVPATEAQFKQIQERMESAVKLFKKVKQSDCIEKEDKKAINIKVDAIIAELTQIKSSQTEEVQQMIDRLFEKLREERYPNNETE